MSEVEYVVTLKKGVDYEAFNQEMIEETGAGNIPNRSTTVANARPGSQRNTHYLLTEAEADALKSDSRVLDVAIPPEQDDSLEIGIQARVTGTFYKGTSELSTQVIDWGKRRHSITTEDTTWSTSLVGSYDYALDGEGVDVVIQDSGLQVDHPEFAIDDLDVDYRNGSIINVNGNGSDFFKREVTTNGVRIMGAGGVGGQTAVPDAWLEKVARMFELFLDPNAAGINKTYQRMMIKTLRGDTGTYHAGLPTLQRVARGAGGDYSTNFLTDAGITFWNLSPLFDSHVANDMVWYLNSTGDGYGDGDIDAQEVIEHVLHTLHMHGLPADDIKLYSFLAADWQSGDLYAAMEEAYDAGKWDSSGYGGNAWKTDADAFEVAAKEYLYLLNFCMFEYTSLWEGGSLAPEWTDDMRTKAGILANNPLGYAFHNTYIAPVISKPPLATIRSIFQDGNTPAQDNPAIAGGSGYVADTGYRVHQIDWYGASGLSGTQSANHYRDTDGHGTHVAGTAAGKHFGWAKNSRVYSVKVAGLEGSGDSGTGISISNCFDVIKLWHRNKPIDPVTGRKRPTIVNMSWGYSTGYGTATSIEYRGTTYSSSNDPSFATRSHLRDTYGLYPYFSNGSYRVPVRVTSVDTDVQELIDEGVHVCIAAGNNSFKVDVDGGDDYGNIVVYSGGSRFYHRGSSPYSTEAFMVGSLLAQNSTADNKVGFSTTGPGVDIYAAGDEITSCTSTTNKFTDAAYYGGGGFRQCNIQGTSMASPQMCGIGALYLQANPMLTPAQLKTMVHNDSVETMQAGSLTGYGDTNDAMGGPRRVAVQRYNKLNSSTSTISGKYSIRS
jgi:subtilisin family serine protease